MADVAYKAYQMAASARMDAERDLVNANRFLDVAASARSQADAAMYQALLEARRDPKSLQPYLDYCEELGQYLFDIRDASRKFAAPELKNKGPTFLEKMFTPQTPEAQKARLRGKVRISSNHSGRQPSWIQKVFGFFKKKKERVPHSLVDQRDLAALAWVWKNPAMTQLRKTCAGIEHEAALLQTKVDAADYRKSGLVFYDLPPKKTDKLCVEPDCHMPWPAELPTLHAPRATPIPRKLLREDPMRRAAERFMESGTRMFPIVPPLVLLRGLPRRPVFPIPRSLRHRGSAGAGRPRRLRQDRRCKGALPLQRSSETRSCECIGAVSMASGAAARAAACRDFL